jgi:F0F1-type ATP synthase membrane subunit c/vacuolar-type H+-ATPase subunit K
MSTAPQPQANLEAALRLVRIIHFAMLAASVLYVLVGEVVATKGFVGEVFDEGGAVVSEHPHEMLANIFLVLGVGLAFAAMLFRQKLASSAQQALLRSPSDAAALGRWRLAHILAFALAETVVLFGLVLRIMGAPLATAAILYAIGFVALLILAPRRP